MKNKIIMLLAAISFLFVNVSVTAAEKPEKITTAKACVVMEANSGRLLYQKNKDERLPEASTTKIMTALVVAENADVNEVVEIPPQAEGVEGSSVYLRAGEHLTVKELLFGLMLRSGNDCAVALALKVGRTIKGFADMMNKKATELGCLNTNFTNPHGLPDDNHYTSAYDLGLISCAAIKNETVKEIVSTKRISISNEGFDYDRMLTNKNKILSEYEGANGIKTGYTKRAGRCFVGSAERNGMQLVTVLLNCGPMFEESVVLMDKFFNEFEMKNLTAGAEQNIDVSKGTVKSVKAVVEKEFFFPLKSDGSENALIKTDISLAEKPKAPVDKGEVVGKIEISFDNQLIFSSNIITLDKVERKSFLDRLFSSEKKT